MPSSYFAPHFTQAPLDPELASAPKSVFNWTAHAVLIGSSGLVLLSSAFFSTSVRAQATMSGIGSDGNVITITAPGGLVTPSVTTNGAGAGAILLQQGASQGSAPTGAIQLIAPAQVAAYTLTLPISGPTASQPLLAFTSDGTGYFTTMPVPASTVTGGASLGSNTFNAPQVINGGGSSLPLVISSSNVNGASIAIDNSSVGGIYTLFYSNGSKNTGIWDYTHFRDTFTCSQMQGGVSCGATHVVSTSARPTIAAGTGAGQGAYVDFYTDANNNPSDQSGVISLVTGVSPVAGSVLSTVTYNQPWLRTTASNVEAAEYAPACNIGPANAVAASLNGPSMVYTNVGTSSSFSVVANSTPLAPNTRYLWTYKCM